MAMKETESNNTHDRPQGYMGMLEYYLKDKAPVQVSKAGREAIVEWGPWIELILLLLSFPSLLLAFGANNTGSAYGGINISWLFLLAQLILQAISLPGLFARKKQGWTFTFLAVGASVVSSLLSFNLLAAIVVFLAGMYILFQVKSYYV